MAEHVDAATIETFTLGFADRSFDESGPAAALARRLGTRHRARRMSEADLLALLPSVRDWLDEPFADASLLPTHLLARFARSHLKVALAGDGGDELLLGYDTFPADTAARLYQRAPSCLRDQVTKFADRLAVRDGNFSLDFMARRFVRGASEPFAPARHLRWLSAVLPGSPDDPLRASLRAAVAPGVIEEVMAGPYTRCPDRDHRQRLSAMYLASYFSGDILTKVDRATMAVGLELRAPFLDPALVDYVVAMPSSLKLRGGLVTKYALKRAFRGRLPAGLRHRRKHGFGMPVARWLRTALAPELRRVLAPARVKAGGFFDPEIVDRLVGEHLAKRRDHRKILWALLVFE
jgi:asparagine synthase (glutamine-hydrolysing)